ncbi:MAG: c-type cytochrome [Bacteroidetes bacterium]|nr:c-type cytochrome [Bacteroidota bacterium]
MRKMQVFVLVGLVCSAFVGVKSISGDPVKPVYIPESVQRSGDTAAGYTYLTTGDYVKGGIPYDFFAMAAGKSKTNYLHRDGINATLSHEYTAVKAPNGETLVAPNCLQCHAQVFEGRLVMGMGNTFADFTPGQKLSPQAYTFLENFLKKGSPQKYEATKSFLQVAKTIGPYLTTQVRGVNAADRLAAVLVAHRDRNTFKWQAESQMTIPPDVIPSDVPAWWLLKKKHAMFYNGFGRGDFGRFLMASNLLTVNDTTESREVDSHMDDVLSYIYSLTPPRYPKPINKALAKQGELLYTTNCSKCHGKYGSSDEYPNLLIPEEIIKTDSMLFKSNYQNPQFVDWFNSSWFAQGDHPARLEPFNGYIAPPLDGVWATAPYLHNGSVPSLEQVLNSKARPAFWERDFGNPEYDYAIPGWKYSVRDAPGGTSVYNTSLPGYGNYGHTFGDKFNDRERKAVIEYLKTL